jgi:hypothetical protein
MRDRPVADIYALTGNGSFVMESLPAAIAAFVVNAEDPEGAILDAVNGGYDADTVGAMAGAFAGAYHGYSTFPKRWTEGLEFESGLRGLGDELAHRAGLGPEPEFRKTNDVDVYSPTVVDGKRWITPGHVVAAKMAPEIQHEIRLQPVPSGALRLATADRRWSTDQDSQTASSHPRSGRQKRRLWRVRRTGT